jgi:hypothetical protein
MYMETILWKAILLLLTIVITIVLIARYHITTEKRDRDIGKYLIAIIIVLCLGWSSFEDIMLYCYPKVGIGMIHHYHQSSKSPFSADYQYEYKGEKYQGYKAVPRNWREHQQAFIGKKYKIIFCYRMPSISIIDLKDSIPESQLSLYQ